MELTIMSFNVRNMYANDGANNWEKRRDLLCATVRKYRPDALVTQEAFQPQVDYLREALPEYASIGVGRDDGKTEGEQCALFFLQERFHASDSGTFWFSETPEIPGSRQWTPAHARICTWVRLSVPSGPTFTVYNVHLDHETQLARERSIVLLLERIGRNIPEPVLVAGDFNMEEDNPAFTPMQAEASALRDSFRLLHPRAGKQGTFHGFTGRQDGERIDFIFASETFRVLEAQILHDQSDGRYPSDHFPILARLRLEE